MTKKVTGKDLQKLIEGVLSEKKIKIPNAKRKRNIYWFCTERTH